MTVELAFPSPLVAARKCTFVRCCKKLEQGAFAVVDVSLDDGARCRKMPSGMLIQPIRYNSCKVCVTATLPLPVRKTLELPLHYTSIEYMLRRSAPSITFE
jgi:uncharacterized protein (UPF0179 family)